jgi:ferredoxin
MKMFVSIIALLPFASIHITKTDAFVSRIYSRNGRKQLSASLQAAPKRLENNVEGPLYVNDRCINCAACSQFAPSSFQLNSDHRKHVVYHQPDTEEEIDEARAALSACPVAAIRTESQAQRSHNNQPSLTEDEQELVKQLALSPKLNARELPFPRPLLSHNKFDKIYFMGHHNEKTFGATPYLFYASQTDRWILVDTPRFGKPAVEALEAVTRGRPPDYLILTHVDDTAGHGLWKDRYPDLRRVFHAGDLGRHNWVGDTTLENVEVLLKETTAVDGKDVAIQAFDLNGKAIDNIEDKEVIILHTPGHSPGSISVLFRPAKNTCKLGVLFTGDTYAYRLASHAMSGFPRYGNDRTQQSKILCSIVKDWGSEWDVIAPGHGHVRDYTMIADSKEKRYRQQKDELLAAMDELQQFTMARW